MKTLMFALLFMVLLMVGCTLPQVIYIDRPSYVDREPSSYPDAAYWNMPASYQWNVDPPMQHMQPVKIPQWCRNPISHTVDPC